MAKEHDPNKVEKSTVARDTIGYPTKVFMPIIFTKDGEAIHVSELVPSTNSHGEILMAEHVQTNNQRDELQKENDRKQANSDSYAQLIAGDEGPIHD